MSHHKHWPLALLAALVLMLSSFGPASHTQAQGNSRTFPETGKTVSGRFLEYWNTHGGLAQQGFPISEGAPEISDTNGKSYYTQYFERAVFELHTEFNPPNDVLLSLLGVFRFKSKYPAGEPSGGNQPPSPPPAPVAPTATPRPAPPAPSGTQTFTGHGQLTTQPFPLKAGALRYHATHNGGSNFIVHILNMDGTTAVFLVNEIGPVDASRVVNIENAGSYMLDVAADGDWSIALQQSGTLLRSVLQQANCHTFPETGKTACGRFLQYWQTHGGLAQQGFPLSGEFTEVSDLNGQPYIVQYFERAVFEFHPEFAPPNDVLLSQLGTFRYREKHLNPPTATPAPVLPTNTPVPPPPTNTPLPAPTNTPQPTGCDVSGNRNGSATPSDVRVGDVVIFRATGFRVGEAISYWFTTPSGIVVGTPAPVPGGFVNPDGSIGPLPLVIDSSFAIFGYGRWAITFQGASSNNVAIIYFCLNR